MNNATVVYYYEINNETLASQSLKLYLIVVVNKQRDNLEHIILNMYPGYKWLTSKQKFVYLLESTNKKINYAVAHFIYIALFCT